MIDLVETSRLKDELNAHPDNYSEIIESTSLGICITDDSGNFFAVNQNYARMYGYSPEEMIGQSFLIVVPTETRTQLQELHDLFMRMKDEIMRNWEVQRKSGDRIKIFADASFSSEIGGSPKKVTFVWPKDENLQQLMKNS